MIDLKLLRENPELIKEAFKKKHFDPKNLDCILALDIEKREFLSEIEKIRAEKNLTSEKIAELKGKEKKKMIEEMQKIDRSEKKLTGKLKKLEGELNELLSRVPNPPLPPVPEGKDETDNKIHRVVGKKPQFDFEPKDHVEIGQKLDLIEIEKAVSASGPRFYYLKNEAVLLEFALIQFVLKKLIKKGFTPIVPPVLVKEKAMFGTGFFPADRNEIYHVNPESDDLFLVGTSEVPLAMLHHNEILETNRLPLHYTGFSSCFRREAGSYGKDTHGILRVHQFDKVEMFSFCRPDEAEKEHELILSLEEEIMQNLGFHYQVVEMCGGDLGTAAARKFDLEVWLPSQNKFRELTSCSNCTDYQARRLNIRFKEKGENKIINTLNGTACAIGRTLIALLENYQNKDGSVTIPKVLQNYLGKEKIEKTF